MNRRAAWIALAMCEVAIILLLLVPLGGVRASRADDAAGPADVEARLLREIQPVKLANCQLERFGEANDGGYLLCGNLLGGVSSGYSYGISGYDGWGCAISRKLAVRVHQYDCFDLTRPACHGGMTTFHGECVGEDRGLKEGRIFGTLAEQIAANGDAGKRLVVKMDVEGSEWDSLLGAPEQVLQRIDQLAIEFHGFDRARFLKVVHKLKRMFHVAHLHWNNYSCQSDSEHFPAWAYEVLFVSKRIARVDPTAVVTLPHPLDAPNRPGTPECRSQ